MAPESSRRLTVASRLTRTAALDAVRRDGQRFRTPRLEVRFLVNTSQRARVGIIVPRHKQTAVSRNRVKRRLRELLRNDLLPALRSRASLDVVVRATPEAYGADLATLAADLQRFVRLLGESA